MCFALCWNTEKVFIICPQPPSLSNHLRTIRKPKIPYFLYLPNTFYVVNSTQKHQWNSNHSSSSMIIFDQGIAIDYFRLLLIIFLLIDNPWKIPLGKSHLSSSSSFFIGTSRLKITMRTWIPKKKRILMTLVHQQSKPLRSKELAFLVTRCNITIVAQFRVVLYFCH